jgi:hypothetical protein
MLFDTKTMKPLLPYERTLISRSSCLTGVPIKLINSAAYIVYVEESIESSKVKISEMNTDGLPDQVQGLLEV